MNKLLLLCALSAAAPALAHEGHDHSATATLNPAWDKLKSLEGDWKGKNGENVNYRLVSGGTALMETIKLPADHGGDMITMYHPDGGSVLMTHYCASGTQPRMRATRIDRDAKLEFKFIDVSNAGAPGAKMGIMKSLVLAFPAEDKLTARWTNETPDKRREPITFELTRAR